MGKIKSAILTAILVAGIVVLAFFATVSYTVPGSNGVKKYNSFITSISLGSDLTGEAVAVLYPEGVISAADYRFGIPEVPEEGAEDYEDCLEKYNKYIGKYEQFDEAGSAYIEKDVLGEDEDAKEIFTQNVKHDAEVLSKRLEEKEYSSYSVTVRDGCTIVVSVPTNFSYSDYSGGDFSTSSRSDKETLVSGAISRLAYGGELSLRNSERGTGKDNILGSVTADVNSYFKSFSSFSRAGQYAIKVKLTKYGKSVISDISKDIVNNASSDKAIGFYVGDNQLLSLNLEEEVTGDSFFITVNNKAMAVEYATVLESCINGRSLVYDYGTANDIDIVYTSPALGDYSAIFLFCAMLAIVLAAMVYSIVRYKLLGFVNSIIIAMYALTIIVAVFLIGIQLTVAGAIFALLGLALLAGCNFVLFEKVRSETQKGKTIHSAIKSAYKSLLKGILELHIVLVAVSLIVALVCVGELAACGLIIFIASIASYLLYWFTRFMWFVVSSTVRDKFAFCGFKREELEDE